MIEVFLENRRILLCRKGFEFYKKQNWYWMQGYVRTTKNPRMFLHRIIIGAKKGEIVDHKNGNRSDNRKSNLRIVTRAQNNTNRRVSSKKRSSCYKGVFWRADIRCWKAIIQSNGKKFYLGNFKTQEEAAHEYDEYARRLHGKYARTNF